MAKTAKSRKAAEKRVKWLLRHFKPEDLRRGEAAAARGEFIEWDVMKRELLVKAIAAEAARNEASRRATYGRAER